MASVGGAAFRYVDDHQDRTRRAVTASLYAANTPDTFWRLLVEPSYSPPEWAAAVRSAAVALRLKEDMADVSVDTIMAAVLGEEVFGPRRWQLSWAKQRYYAVKPWLPRRLTLMLRRRYRRQQEGRFPLAWPIEDRHVRFLYLCAAHLLDQRGLPSAPFVNFWPDGHRYALVLTHDVEQAAGQAHVGMIATWNNILGFRSSFNFVAERYPIDHGLVKDLRSRGFEVGLHGIAHDGKLFSSRHAFDREAAQINQYIHNWNVAGFRAPMTHRNPEWMQALNVEYDSSFFDTDPYEVMPGGTMSIWPFFLGHFIELPYTLPQDHTLMVILGERTPRLWLDKVAFVAQWRGMALINTHPDYLREPGHLAIYEGFLTAMREQGGYWHALPRSVARWWRQRADFQYTRTPDTWDVSGLAGATLAYLDRAALDTI